MKCNREDKEREKKLEEKCEYKRKLKEYAKVLEDVKMSHLKFIVVEEKVKTKVFSVVSSHDNSTLGDVRWHSGWRQYVFCPEQECIWSWDCLKELSDFIKKLMDDREKMVR